MAKKKGEGGSPEARGLTSDCHSTPRNPKGPPALPQSKRKGRSNSKDPRVGLKNKDAQKYCSREIVSSSFTTHLSEAAWTAPCCPGKRNPSTWVTVHESQTWPLHVSSSLGDGKLVFPGSSASGRIHFRLECASEKEPQRARVALRPHFTKLGRAGPGPVPGLLFPPPFSSTGGARTSVGRSLPSADVGSRT